MDKNELLNGYKEIIRNIYSSKSYYERVILFLKNYNSPFVEPFSFLKFKALIKSFIYLGVFWNNRLYYWKTLFWCAFHKPRSLPLAVTYSIYGYHFRRVFRDVI
jgi:hypothetical protein